MATTSQLPTNDDQKSGNTPPDDFGRQFGMSPEEEAKHTRNGEIGAIKDMYNRPSLGGKESEDGEDSQPKSSPGLDQIRQNEQDSIGRNSFGASPTDLREPKNMKWADRFHYGQDKKDKKKQKNNDKTQAKIPKTDARTSGLFNKSDDSNGRFSRLKNLKSKLGKGGALKIGGGVGVAIFLLILFLAVAALKLPDVMEGIESYEFAAASQQFFDDSNNINDEALAVTVNDDDEEAGNSVFDKLYDFYGTLGDFKTSVTNGIWNKVVGDNPDAVLDNLRTNNGLSFRYKKSIIPGRPNILQGGSINGVDYDIVPPSGIGKWVPGVKTYLKFKGEQPLLGQNGFIDTVGQQMLDNNVGLVIRGTIMRRLILSTGGGLQGWLLNRFTNSTPTKDDPDPQEDTAIQEQYQAGEEGDTAPDNSVLAQEAAAVEDGKAAENQAAQNPTEINEDINDDGVIPEVEAAVNKNLATGLVQTILHYTGMVYLIFAPICIAFMGSVQQSGPDISNQMNQVQDAFDQLAAEADQQKQGDLTASDGGELANAVSGTNDEIGDISTSIPYQRAYGQVESTDFIPSVEAGSDGSYEYSIFNALGIPADTPQGKAINAITGNICQIMTSIWTSVGLTVAQLILALVSFGAEPAAADSAGETATQFITRFITETFGNIFGTKTLTTITGDTIKETFMARAIRFALGQATVVGATLGLTFLAHLEVASRAGIANDGLNTGSNLVDLADNGAEIQAGELARQQLFGRPLLEAEVAQQEESNATYVDYVNSQKSFTQRYFALDNYDSLLTHVGMDLGAADHANTLASIVKLGSSILRPVSAIAGVIGTLTGSNTSAYAAGDPEDYNYGNVMFGWSQAENQLIASSVTYKPLENQKILDDASTVVVNGTTMSRQDAIAMKYSTCFGYDYSATGNGDLDPNDTAGNLVSGATDATVSALLASSPPKIVRDGTTGDVINGGGLCDPDNLSFDSTDTLAEDAQTPELNGWKSPQGKDMIFRWRLALAYDTTADQLISEGKINDTGE